eukprot:934013_1
MSCYVLGRACEERGEGGGCRWLRGNGVRGSYDERKEASVLEVVRGVDGNSSLYMVMVGLLMFNLYWVQFEIESNMNYECKSFKFQIIIDRSSSFGLIHPIMKTNEFYKQQYELRQIQPIGHIIRILIERQ